MRNLSILAILIIIITLAATITAQEKPVFEVINLTDQIYKLTTDEGAYTTNVLAFVGDDGVLLVDANSAENAVELKKVIDSFGKGLPVYIINTHRHVEHVGGNAIFGPTPVVIAHYLVPKKLRSGSYLFDEYPDETFPDITFADSLNLFFNGEQIRLISMPGSHDDNEIIVHFTKSKIVHLSSLINGMNFPSVDSDGSPLKFEELLIKAIKLLPKDVTIVSGHNGLATWQDLNSYKDMIQKSTAIVAEGMAAGKDAKILQEEKVLAEFESFNKSYVSTSEWTEYLFDALVEQKNPVEKKRSIYEPLYYALKEGGAQKAIEKYFELKNDTTGSYKINEADLLIIGDKLLGKNNHQDAIELLKLDLKEHPKGSFNYYSHYDLSSAYKNLGDKKLALEHCRKALELKPEFKGASNLLVEIEKM